MNEFSVRERACRSLLEKQKMIDANPESVTAYVIQQTEYAEFVSALGAELPGLLATKNQTTGNFLVWHINVSGIQNLLLDIEKKKKGNSKKRTLKISVGVVLSIVSICVSIYFGVHSTPSQTQIVHKQTTSVDITNSQTNAPIINGEVHGNININK